MMIQNFDFISNPSPSYHLRLENITNWYELFKNLRLRYKTIVKMYKQKKGYPNC